MNEEFLGNGHGNRNPHGIEHHRNGGERQAQVRQGQPGEEIVHGLTKRRFRSDDTEDSAVSQEGWKIHEVNRNGDPNVYMLKTWDPDK